MLAKFLLLIASIWIDTGWQPVGDKQDELEYIIQIGPELYEELRNRPEGITSVIHPDARGVTRFRIIVGEGELPRRGLPVKPPLADEDATDGDSIPNLPAGEPRYPASSTDDRYPQYPNPPVPDDTPKLEGDPQMPRDYAPPERPSLDDPSDVSDTSDKLTGPRSFDLQEPAQPLGEPTGQRATYERPVERAASEADSPSQPATAPAAEPPSPSRPWLPLLVTVVGLAGSLAGNFYLGALWLETRRRFNQLTAEQSADL